MRVEVIMRTTVDIDTQELDELVRLTGAASRSAALAAGMKALRERVTLGALADLIERSPAHHVEPAPRRRA
jgi:ATP-dependent 26S proteasome regulatory subunit